MWKIALLRTFFVILEDERVVGGWGVGLSVLQEHLPRDEQM